MPSSASNWQRLIQRIAAFRPVTLAMAKILPSIDRTVLRMSGNRYTLTAMMTGLPVVMLTTTGARSGQPRTLPLVALEDGERLVLIASNFGQERHPAWSYNLRAHPVAEVKLRGQTKPYRAREANAEEQAVYWRQAVAIYPGYAAYKERAANRQIPIFVLEPEGMGAQKKSSSPHRLGEDD